MPDTPSLDDAEAHFRDLLDREGIAQPDEVEHDVEASEVIFLWHEPKVAIVIEVGPEGPAGVRPGVPPPPV